MGERKHGGYRGYVTSRPFGGYSIPVPVQSLVLRDYCQRKGLLYVLPVNENAFHHSYLVLEGMVQDLRDFQGVVMCSMSMLPRRAQRRGAILKSILAQSCSLHLVLEGLVVARPQDIAVLEELIELAQIAARAPTQMPLEP
ncbi:MAG TPA: LIC12192 family sporadic carbohydrate cluster protein [Hyphomicrobiaceae bacterium]|nr:LIC12192 family sporadic carbohydrate cluster protein [Hyphomicrobiaceae bacterium]